MLNMDAAVPVNRSLSQTEILAALLEATGDLDKAQVLQKGMPDWLLKGGSPVLAALDTDIQALLIYQQKCELLMHTLQSLDGFCASQLSAALTKKWTVAFDVDNDVLVLPGVDCDCEATSTEVEGIEKVLMARHSLLQAAMQNFTADESAPGGFPAGSTLEVASAPLGVTALTPQAFATFCRELDLGKRYQAHISEVFNLSATSGTLSNDLKSLKLMKLKVDAHLAYLKKHITQEAYKSLLLLNIHSGTGAEAGVQSILHGTESLIIQGMELFSTCVWGVVVFSRRSVEAWPTEWCVVYMPNEPDRPLHEYSTFAEFKSYLIGALKKTGYMDYFAHGIEEDRKQAFAKSFAQSGNLDTFKALPITLPLFQFMIQSSLGKMQVDARVLAVPTADIDEEARKKRLERYLEQGLTIANVAAFFVPVLGQLMIGVSVGMLLGEVYDGVQDWQHGDKQEALSHLFSVAENIALMTTFAVGGKVVGSLIRKTVREHPEFFSRFEAVTHGKPRLWRSGLDPYKRPLSTLSGHAADWEGVYQVDGQPHIRIDDDVYRIQYDPMLKKWRVRHPLRPDAFSPVLEHNGEGGWRLSFEQPQQWRTGSYALKRLDARLAAQEDSRLEKIRSVCGTSIAELHQLSEEGQVLNARLKDTIRRFRLDERIRDFIADLERGDSRSTAYLSEQLHALPLMKDWPQGRFIRVLDAEQNVTAFYPPTARLADADLAVDVSVTQLAQGKLFETVVASLYQSEVDTLLVNKAVTETESEALAKKLAASVKADRLPLFDRLYEFHGSGSGSGGDAGFLKTAFPRLPTAMAQELVDQASSVERLRLRTTRRVPLALAYNARKALAQIRLDQAISGFYLPEIAGAETNKLALSLLEHLRGWDSKLLLEVREGSVTGEVLQRVGKPDSAFKRTIVQSASGYQAFDGDANPLAAVAKGPDALYATIVQALPQAQRTAMGRGILLPEDAWRLRSQLLARATEERQMTARILAGEPVVDTPEPVSCVQADPAAPSSRHASALLRKTRKLYPLMSETEIDTLLDGLGTDHLTRATAIQQRQRQLEKLRELLKVWCSDNVEMRKLAGNLGEYQHSRRQVADAIVNSWRRLVVLRDERGIGVPGIRLDGMRVGKLPTLAQDLDFSHIKHLSLKGMEQADDLAYFLKHFKALEVLELDNNKLKTLPEVLSLMPKLKHLSFKDNQLVLTEHTLAKLASMRTLTSLNLSNNRLGATPDLSKMFDLRMLSLRDTRATELPKGLNRLPNLDHVDLRNNEITALPEWLFFVPKRFSEVVNLRTNPLDTISRIKLKSYRDRTGVGMGFLEDDIARMNEQEAKKLWLPEDVSVTFPRRGPIWATLKDDPRSEGLFQLLAEVGNTADSQYVREDMTTRVWSILEATEGHGALREQLFDLAASPINCTDSAAMNFSHLEVAVAVDKVVGTSRSAQSAAPLLKLGRGLFRLDQLDKVAQSHIQKNPTVDPLEVSLAYRTGLADTFDLPGQPRHMRFASLSGVAAADLATAQHVVKTAELSSELLKFMVQWPYWADYLKSHYPRQFAKVNDPLQVRLQSVFDQAESLKDVDYRQQIDALNSEQAAAEKTVLEKLTQDAIKLVDLGVCAVPES